MASSGSPRVELSSMANFKSTTHLMVRVGQEPQQEEFAVHASVMSARSEYFKRALNGHWVESEKRLVTLDDVDPGTFGIYLNHVYTNMIPTKDTVVTLRVEFERLGEVYILSERLQDTSAKNAIITAMIEVLEQVMDGWARHVPSSYIVSAIYNGTPEQSAAQRLVVDAYVNYDLAQARLDSGRFTKNMIGKFDRNRYVEKEAGA